MAYGRRFIKRGARRVKRRYYGKRKGVKVNTLARDVYKIKRMLNTEHKHFDYKFGSGQAVAAQYPVNNAPIILALPPISKGTNYDDRVGNQLKIVHVTCKVQFMFHQTSDQFQRNSARFRLIFAKSAENVPDIAKLLEPDANGHYTNLSFVNGQEYKKFVWLKTCDLRSAFTQPALAGTGGIDAPDQAAMFVKTGKSKCSITMMFKNNTNEIEQMKPYVVLTSNVAPSGGSHAYDPISISGQVRLTYVDN